MFKILSVEFLLWNILHFVLTPCHSIIHHKIVLFVDHGIFYAQVSSCSIYLSTDDQKELITLVQLLEKLNKKHNHENTEPRGKFLNGIYLMVSRLARIASKCKWREGEIFSLTRQEGKLSFWLKVCIDV